MFGYAKFVWLRDGVFLSYGKRGFITTSKRNIDGESIGINCKETESNYVFVKVMKWLLNGLREVEMLDGGWTEVGS